MLLLFRFCSFFMTNHKRNKKKVSANSKCTLKTYEILNRGSVLYESKIRKQNRKHLT